MTVSTRFDDLFVYRDLTEADLAEYREQGFLVHGRVLSDRGFWILNSEFVSDFEFK